MEMVVRFPKLDQAEKPSPAEALGRAASTVRISGLSTMKLLLVPPGTAGDITGLVIVSPGGLAEVGRVEYAASAAVGAAFANVLDPSVWTVAPLSSAS